MTASAGDGALPAAGGAETAALDPARRRSGDDRRARTWARVLRGFLRFEAAVMGLAVLAVVLPTETMDSIHRSLGLGPLPTAPIVEYLTRSLSALYVAWGSLLWITSRDLERYRPVITYMATAAIVLGLVLLAVDLAAGMPWYWVASDVGLPLAGGTVVLTLQRLATGSSAGPTRFPPPRPQE